MRFEVRQRLQPVPDGVFADAARRSAAVNLESSDVVSVSKASPVHRPKQWQQAPAGGNWLDLGARHA
jgi:hypothetical protein